MFCEERGDDWWDVDGYRAFTNHLSNNGVRMQKFPLCIKESGGTYERGRDKTRFLEELSKLSTDDSSAYTIKLSDSLLKTIRLFHSNNLNHKNETRSFSS
jgi:hypothetical protein